jgi:hypothetical protein
VPSLTLGQYSTRKEVRSLGSSSLLENHCTQPKSLLLRKNITRAFSSFFVVRLTVTLSPSFAKDPYESTGVSRRQNYNWNSSVLTFCDITVSFPVSLLTVDANESVISSADPVTHQTRRTPKKPPHERMICRSHFRAY